MSIRERILSDIKVAMKAREADRLSTLRFINSAFKNKEIEVRPNSLTEQDCLAVLKKLGKQHKDSMTQYGDAGREDLVEKEKAELEIVSSYLPEQLSREKVEGLVTEAISELGATEMKAMGQVMKLVLEKAAGMADNKLVSEIVKEKLT